jgi:tripeptide aminopeptidase
MALTVYSTRTLAYSTNLETTVERNIDDYALFIEETFVDLARIQSQTDTSGRRKRPSSPGQVEVLRRIESILRDEIGGIYDIEYKADVLIATIEGEGSAEGYSIGFMSHVDVTSDFGTGAEVKPIVWQGGYGGEILRLPINNVTLDPSIVPHLADSRGETLITASGDSALGADDKAGVVIMLALARRVVCSNNGPMFPWEQVNRPKIVLYFVPDGESVGIGTAYSYHSPSIVDTIFHKDCRAVYVVDGGEPGDVRYETMTTIIAKLDIEGFSMHTGFAKGTDGHGKLYNRTMVNALLYASRLVAAIAGMGISPEDVDGRHGFIHFFDVSGNVERAQIQAWVRAFEDDEVNRYLDLLDSHCQTISMAGGSKKSTSVPKCTMKKDNISFNTRQWFDKNGWLPVNLAEKAMNLGGIPPVSTPVRGNTDASFITKYFNLPAVHLYSAWHASHGPMEWTSVQKMSFSLCDCSVSCNQTASVCHSIYFYYDMID